MTFPYPPIAIPSNDEKVCKPEHSTAAHYATLVLVSDLENNPFVFEFAQNTLDEISAYSARHSGLHGIELLVSREPTSENLRLRVGPSLDPSDVEILASKYETLYQSLYERYLERIGSQLHN